MLAYLHEYSGCCREFNIALLSTARTSILSSAYGFGYERRAPARESSQRLGKTSPIEGTWAAETSLPAWGKAVSSLEHTHLIATYNGICPFEIAVMTLVRAVHVNVRSS